MDLDENWWKCILQTSRTFLNQNVWNQTVGKPKFRGQHVRVTPTNSADYSISSVKPPGTDGRTPPDHPGWTDGQEKVRKTLFPYFSSCEPPLTPFVKGYLLAGLFATSGYSEKLQGGFLDLFYLFFKQFSVYFRTNIQKQIPKNPFKRPLKPFKTL